MSLKNVRQVCFSAYYYSVSLRLSFGETKDEKQCIKSRKGVWPFFTFSMYSLCVLSSLICSSDMSIMMFWRYSRILISSSYDTSSTDVDWVEELFAVAGELPD